MPSYIKTGGAWQELTGLDRPYVKVSGSWQGVTNGYAKVSGTWQQVYQYDNTAPTIPTPTVVKNGSSFDVTWGAITDSESGVASATLQQVFIGSSSGEVNGSTYSITSGGFGGGTTTMTVPTNRRNTPSGETWEVSFKITATDVANNQATGNGSIYQYTRPLGTYSYLPTDAESFGTSWSNFVVADEAVVRRSTTWQYGAFFYGTNITSGCKGHTADSGTIFVKRSASGAVFEGNTGTFTFRVHNLTSASGTPTFAGTNATQSLSGTNASATITMPGDWLSAFGAGTSYGVALTDHSNQPGGVRGKSDFSGLVTLVYN
jgi:hypothetical protein